MTKPTICATSSFLYFGHSSAYHLALPFSFKDIMSDKHKHRLLLHTNVSYVLVYPRSPLCATLPSHMISGPSCHALRPIPSPYDHLTSPHLQGWTHALCSALPCDTLSSGCPMPAIFTALFSSFPLPMSSYALLYSCFFTSRELLIYPSFLIHQK